ncbi:hypothetical protein HMI49_29605 [Corallococcus exercitus]|uniref:Uncharacterized protein n=1 Tax=Corallococcus exercitus TaxID=2316736 RepID=A0A7Y4NVI2_9BACT|nr:hypothetical protein [Corallococcus exercitus]NOK37358.1 hypothetical protein [Corallococcus exercitus]
MRLSRGSRDGVMFLIGLGLGLGLRSLVEAATKRTGRTVGKGSPADMPMEGPAESWRGSGLAEDVGAEAASTGQSGEDPDRERKMREAERQLGLPAL